MKKADDNDSLRAGALPADPFNDGMVPVAAPATAAGVEEGRTDASVLTPLGSLFEQELARLNNGIERMGSGWPRLDRVLRGGFVVPSLVMLGAAPKAGKSTWCQLVAERHAEAGGFVYYLDFENGSARFVRRMFARRSRLDPERLTERGTDEERRRFFKAKEEMGPGGKLGSRLYLDTARDLSPAALTARVRLMGEKASAAGARLLVVVDSLQKLPMPMAERRNGIDGWLRALEALRDGPARPVVLVVSELKRDEKGRYSGRDATLKESGSIEYTGDLVLFLRGEDDETERLANGGETHGPPKTLTVEWNRDGATGRVASYRAEFPHHGMQEDDAASGPPKKSKAGKGDAAGREKPRRFGSVFEQIESDD
jgi:replicative DNA helicase